MDPISALGAVDSVSSLEPAPISAPERVDGPPPATHASTCTGFDRYPCILDQASASIAAAAAAQDLRTFQLSQLRMRRIDEKH